MKSSVRSWVEQRAQIYRKSALLVADMNLLDSWVPWISVSKVLQNVATMTPTVCSLIEELVLKHDN